MPPRPRTPHGDGDPPHEPGSPPRPYRAGTPGSAAQAEQVLAEVFSHGRPTSAGGAGPLPTVRSADDIELSRWDGNYDGLGGVPPRFTIATNDDAHAHHNAHTGFQHGPQLPLRRDPAMKTIEGRIYGDTGWIRPANGSFKWTDASTMNRTINDHVSQNWEVIRNELAIYGQYETTFDAGHRVGEGFVNKGMGGAGPRQAQYAVTSIVRIVIHVAPGSDPPEPFIVTAFPAGLG